MNRTVYGWKRSDSDLTYYPVFVSEQLGKPRKTSVIIGIPTEIQSGVLSE
jgi:hypothetical protein